jgi:hypothetical protein
MKDCLARNIRTSNRAVPPRSFTAARTDNAPIGSILHARLSDFIE